MSSLQILDGQREITLGRRQGTVAEDFLDVSQVGPVLHQVRGARVPPQVTVHVLFDSRKPRVFFHQVDHRLRGHGPPHQRQKEGAALPAFQKFVTNTGNVTFQIPHRPTTQRHNPVFLSLARSDVKQAVVKLHVVEFQRHEFAPAKAGRVKHFQNGPVAVAKHGRRIGGLDDLFGLHGRKHVARQLIRFACKFDCFGRIARNDALSFEEAKEAPYPGKHPVGRGRRASRPTKGRLIKKPLLKVSHDAGSDHMRLGDSSLATTVGVDFREEARELRQVSRPGADRLGRVVERFQVVQVSLGKDFKRGRHARG